MAAEQIQIYRGAELPAEMGRAIISLLGLHSTDGTQLSAAGLRTLIGLDCYFVLLFRGPELLGVLIAHPTAWDPQTDEILSPDWESELSAVIQMQTQLAGLSIPSLEEYLAATPFRSAFTLDEEEWRSASAPPPSSSGPAIPPPLPSLEPPEQTAERGVALQIIFLCLDPRHRQLEALLMAAIRELKHHAYYHVAEQPGEQSLSVRAWQISAKSQSEPPVSWRSFRMTESTARSRSQLREWAGSRLAYRPTSVQWQLYCRHTLTFGIDRQRKELQAIYTLYLKPVQTPTGLPSVTAQLVYFCCRPALTPKSRQQCLDMIAETARQLGAETLQGYQLGDLTPEVLTQVKWSKSPRYLILEGGAGAAEEIVLPIF